MSFHRKMSAGLTGLIACTIALGVSVASAQNAQDTVRVAYGDVIDVQALPVVIALERAKARGVNYVITSFSEEDLAIQAVVADQADIGMATPFAVMQKVAFTKNKALFSFPSYRLSTRVGRT